MCTAVRHRAAPNRLIHGVPPAAPGLKSSWRMALSATRTLNRSAHTLRDVSKLAKANPEKATAYLRDVEEGLRAGKQTAAAKAVHQVLGDETGSLVERIAEHEKTLAKVFPASAEAWGKVQLERAATVGYGQQPEPDAQLQYVKGKVLRGTDGALVMKTEGGRELQLAASALRTTLAYFPPSWMAGMMDDGPLSLSGTLGEDGKTFNVEGYALNRDGRYDTFTIGRVEVQGEQVTIQTPRGDVTIADPTLEKKMKVMPRLGVILPGAPEEKDGKLVYGGKPDEWFGLGRFVDTRLDGTGAMRTARVDMAYSIFADKPVHVPAAQAGRVNHSGRLWLEGDVTMRAGKAVSFTASYVSQQTDSSSRMQAAVLDADPLQAAVMTEVV